MNEAEWQKHLAGDPALRRIVAELGGTADYSDPAQNELLESEDGTPAEAALVDPGDPTKAVNNPLLVEDLDADSAVDPLEAALADPWAGPIVSAVLRHEHLDLTLQEAEKGAAFEGAGDDSEF